MDTIRITNLRLRTIIGTNDWERKTLQDILINITIEFDAAKPAQSDNLHDTVDYKKITKRIIKFVEASQFFLLEKLTEEVLNLIMEDQKIQAATVRIDKPHALRFADSVALEITRRKKF